MQAASEFALDPSGAAERHCRLFSECMGEKKKKKNAWESRILYWAGKSKRERKSKACDKNSV